MNCSYSPRHLFDDLLDLRRILHACAEQPNRGAEETLFRATEMARARSTPSTKTFDVAVGKLHALHNIRERSNRINFFGLGSSTEASCCVERKIFLSPASASSSAPHAGFAADDEGKSSAGER